MHLVLKGSNWYLEHRLSPKQSTALGRSKLSRSLKTDSKREAQRRRILLEMEWRRRIASACEASPDATRQTVEYWRRALEDSAGESDRELTLGFLQDELEESTFAAARHAGVDIEDRDAVDDLPQVQKNVEIYQRVTGQKVDLLEYAEEYFARSQSAQKTKDQHRAAIRRLAEYAPFVSSVSLAVVQRYFDDRAAAGIARATLQRERSGIRGYWRWLSRRLDTIDRERDPFNVDIASQSKKLDTRRKGYTSAEAVGLLRAAVSKPDPTLADLVRLGMFSGARIEEICALTPGDANLDADTLTIRDSKTRAGIRTVPIHPLLRPVVERLKRNSSDGFLLSGLSVDKYEKRSPAISKRFSHLKGKEGFGPQHVFHSFRNTIKTQLRNQGVPKDLNDDIMGHEPGDDMMRVYYDPTLGDGRRSLEARKAEAMARVSYPDLEPDDMA